jgi:hypothetical protein
MEFSTKEDSPPIILNFFDTDIGWLDSDDDYMGRSVIYFRDIIDLSEDDRIPKPEWYPVKFKLDDPWEIETGAALLASFALVPFDEFDFALQADEMDLS